MFKPPFALCGVVVVWSSLGCVLPADADDLPVAPASQVSALDTLLPKSTTPGVPSAPASGLQRRLAKPKPRPEDAQKALAVVRNQKACNTRLDLTVEKATLEEIVAQIGKTLGEKAPQIVVRDALPIRLSFALKDSTAKEALETTGELAGVKLWVLSDHLLLAPQTALTQDETQALDHSSRREVQRVLASLLADEVRAKLGGNAQATGAGDGAKITLGMLSPEGQEMVLGLFTQTEMSRQARRVVNTFNGISNLQAPPTLSPSTEIQLNPQGTWRPTPNSPGADVVGIKEGIWGMHWATSGDMSGGSYALPPSRKSAPPVAPLFDPSAKKS